MSNRATPAAGEQDASVFASLFKTHPTAHMRRLQRMAHAAENGEWNAHSEDPLPGSGDLAALSSMQNQAVRRYFQLWEASRKLPGAPKPSESIVREVLELERKRIARHLHTGVMQALVGIGTSLGLVQQALADQPESVKRHLNRIELLSLRAVTEVRDLSHGLYTPAWQGQPLVEALRDLWDTSGIREIFATDLDLSPLAHDPPLDQRVALYLAAQEGISNAVRHSKACHVRMSLCERHGGVELAIEDDGIGLKPRSGAAAETDGIGLNSLRDLARQLGGDFRIEGGPHGTRLSMTFWVAQ